MVSLITRSEYIKQFESDEYTHALIDFLLDRKLNLSSELSYSNADDLSIYALQAIQDNNQSLFVNAYDQINRRKPTPHSDWIYNDILLFSLTLGVCKFKLDPGWLVEILDMRRTHSDDEKNLVAQTFIDILKENFDSKNNCFPLMLVIKYLLDLPLGNAEYINSVYRELIQNNFPYFKAIFLNLISIKAMDVILLAKGLIDWERHKAVLEFTKTFEKRTHQMGTILWGLLVVAVFALSIWFLYYFVTSPTQQADIISRVLTFLPYLGLGGIVPIFTFKRKIVNFFEKPFHYFYGYRLRQYIDAS